MTSLLGVLGIGRDTEKRGHDLLDDDRRFEVRGTSCLAYRQVGGITQRPDIRVVFDLQRRPVGSYPNLRVGYLMPCAGCRVCLSITMALSGENQGVSLVKKHGVLLAGQVRHLMGWLFCESQL